MENPRTPAQIEAEISEARDRLASNVEQLVNQINPKAVAQRNLQQAKDLVSEKTARVKREIIADDGSWRKDRVAMIAAGFAGLVILITVLKKLLKR